MTETVANDDADGAWRRAGCPSDLEAIDRDRKTGAARALLAKAERAILSMQVPR
jgi:hypothetical protein